MFRFGFPGIAVLLVCFPQTSHQQQRPSIGIFDGQADVGSVLHTGSAAFDSSGRSYTLTGSGNNMWFDRDEFHFIWKKMSGRDVSLGADIAILGSDGDPHRKAVLMIRQDLDSDSAYVDAARHGEGLTSLQFREIKGAITREVESDVSGPARVQIEKRGHRFYMWVSGEDGKLEFAGGSAKVEMHDPFYVGLGVCAHRKDDLVKASFSNVELRTDLDHHSADYSTIETVIESGDARTAYVSAKRLTSPGWSSDGKAVTYELDGKSDQVPFAPLRTAAPVGEPLSTQTAQMVLLTRPVAGTTQIFRGVTGGEPAEQLTSDDYNNVDPQLSPDGKFIAFLSYPKELPNLPVDKDVSLRMMSLEDKGIHLLANFVGGQGSLGQQPWSPDGKRIVFISYQHME